MQKSVRKVIKPDDYEEEATQALLERPEDLREALLNLEEEMWRASEALDFERAALIRDQMRSLEARMLGLPEPTTAGKQQRRGRRRR